MRSESMQAAHGVGWLDAQAPWPVGVRAGFTLRQGGVSEAPWASLNLGDHVGDCPDHVLQNRLRLGRALDVEIGYLRQVHGLDVVQLEGVQAQPLVADACWTDAPRKAATVLVADCLPILLASADGRSVAAVHAGWRGLAGFGGLNVLDALIRQWPAARSAAGRQGLCVWLGPCIGPQAFEVGAEVMAAFTHTDAGAAACFTRLPSPEGAPKWLADLPQLARRALHRLGVTNVHGNDGSPDWCTVTQPSRFFSHRRDARLHGTTGRMAALIWREPRSG